MRLVTRADFDGPAALVMADEALHLARATGIEVARAQSLLGTARLAAGDPRCIEDFGEAIATARLSGDVDVECTASDSLVTGHLMLGDLEASEAVACRATNSPGSKMPIFRGRSSSRQQRDCIER